MLINVWRITTARWAPDAFSGEGARRYGGRYNSPGRAVVYTAGSQALAVLEMLVHLDGDEALDQYVMIPARVPADLVLALDAEALPAAWRDYPPPRAVQALGDAWLEARDSAVLRVPSVVVPGESNYLINPAHHDAGRIEIGQARPLELDPRLRGS